MARDRRVGGIETVMGGDPGEIESVIRKRFEPAQHDWLSSPAGDAAEPERRPAPARLGLVTPCTAIVARG